MECHSGVLAIIMETDQHLDSYSGWMGAFGVGN
jgi:hypothetical protein